MQKHIENYLKFSRISYCKDCVAFYFCDKESEENWIHFYDFELNSNCIYTKKEIYMLNLIYKKFMYKKFGTKYVEEMSNAKKGKCIDQCKSAIDEINKEIIDIIK